MGHLVFKILLSIHLIIFEKELWTSTSKNDTFQKITITVVEVIFIQVSFLNLGSKQSMKMNTQNTVASSCQFKGLLKTWESHFLLLGSLVGIISTCFGKGKVFSDNSNPTSNVSMKTVNELDVFLTGFIVCLKKHSCYSTQLY